jgi:hypothetical protein
MSILICSTTYGGCGTFRSSEQFGGNGDYVICPTCGEDHAFQLTDENFDSLTNEHNRTKARELLDADHAAVHGSYLSFCVKKGFVSKNRLTKEQKKKLGL